MSSTIKTGIIGGAGYTGGELIRLLVNHPAVELTFIHSRSNAGQPVSAVHQDLLGETDLRFTDNLQKDIDYKKRQLQLTELQRDNLSLQKNFYQTREYQELAIRESLGLVLPGEKALVLPANSEAAKKADTAKTTAPVAQATTSNLEQWVNFLFGGYSKSISDK